MRVARAVTDVRLDVRLSVSARPRPDHVTHALPQGLQGRQAPLFNTQPITEYISDPIADSQNLVLFKK